MQMNADLQARNAAWVLPQSAVFASLVTVLAASGDVGLSIRELAETTAGFEEWFAEQRQLYPDCGLLEMLEHAKCVDVDQARCSLNAGDLKKMADVEEGGHGDLLRMALLIFETTSTWVSSQGHGHNQHYDEHIQQHGYGTAQHAQHGYDAAQRGCAQPAYAQPGQNGAQPASASRLDRGSFAAAPAAAAPASEGSGLVDARVSPDASAVGVAARPSVFLVDLDGTLVHVLKYAKMPKCQSITDAIVPLRTAEHNVLIAVRRGAGGLLATLKRLGIRVEIVTMNTIGAEVTRAIADSDAPDAELWRDIPVVVVTCHESGAKKLRSADNCLILDDSPKYWEDAARPFVIHARRFDVMKAIPTRDEFKIELNYLATIAHKLQDNSLKPDDEADGR
ncbi:hypothetical protein M885DRAFT_532322 [Pelagophyceae sp. CCMP2097]|nr:hypothetical protein M885DRAFT_532322 [Pelagophyceae sp. CCMP2097]|mmetsp:Transcript_22288/g.75355  ORF Transcript_22288/g.75355 Transcript_22288/m.75355 type:complete len:393 (+) Transcript_22288:66-1244(+)